MNLDEQLAELLARLGVTLDTGDEAGEAASAMTGEAEVSIVSSPRRPAPVREVPYSEPGADEDAGAPAEVSLFQTSREHYGVFYRLDLVAGAPQLRIFTPAEDCPVKMRCFLVRAAIGTPVREWFLATRTHDGSAAYDEMRDTAEQHLLFAAGEALKRLFWAGDAETSRFPEEIEVSRLI